MPMRGVEIERAHVTYIQQIPAYALALFHGHHRPVAVEISVDRKLEVGLGESAAGERAESTGPDRNYLPQDSAGANLCPDAEVFPDLLTGTEL